MITEVTVTLDTAGQGAGAFTRTVIDDQPPTVRPSITPAMLADIARCVGEHARITGIDIGARKEES